MIVLTGTASLASTSSISLDTVVPTSGDRPWCDLSALLFIGVIVSHYLLFVVVNLLLYPRFKS